MRAQNRTARQAKAVVALLATPSLKEAAAQVGCAEKTIARWLREPEFAEQYRQAREAVFDQALAALQGMAGEAVEALRRSLRPERPPSVQTRAAEVALSLAAKAREGDLAARLASVEQQLAELVADGARTTVRIAS